MLSGAESKAITRGFFIRKRAARRVVLLFQCNKPFKTCFWPVKKKLKTCLVYKRGWFLVRKRVIESVAELVLKDTRAHTCFSHVFFRYLSRANASKSGSSLETTMDLVDWRIRMTRYTRRQIIICQRIYAISRTTPGYEVMVQTEI